MKPRIQPTTDGEWRCQCLMGSGFGKTPEDAYQDWFHNTFFRKGLPFIPTGNMPSMPREPSPPYILVPAVRQDEKIGMLKRLIRFVFKI